MKTKKVLIVEDELIVAKSMERTLNNYGYLAYSGPICGEEAFDYVRDIDPDIVLLDIRLKGNLDGIGTALGIKEQKNVPIVYITAYADDDTIRRAKKTSPYGYLVKPFSDREMIATIEIALKRFQIEENLLKKIDRYLENSKSGIGNEIELDIHELIKASIELVQEQQVIEADYKNEAQIACIAESLNSVGSIGGMISEVMKTISESNRLSSILLCSLNEENVIDVIADSLDEKETQGYWGQLLCNNSSLGDRLLKCKNDKYITYNNTNGLNSDDILSLDKMNIKALLVIPIKHAPDNIIFGCYAKESEYDWSAADIELYKRITKILWDGIRRDVLGNFYKLEQDSVYFGKVNNSNSGIEMPGIKNICDIINSIKEHKEEIISIIDKYCQGLPKKYLKEILEFLNSVNQLNGLLKNKNHTICNENQLINIKESMGKILWLLEEAIKRKKIRIITEIANKDLCIAIKRTYFEQIVFSIFSEMVCESANSRSGINKMIKLKFTEEDNAIVMKIQNNFLLIPKELTHNYMNIFSFQKHSRKNTSGGHPIIKSFVNLLGGGMTFMNNKCGGYTYTLKLPRCDC